MSASIVTALQQLGFAKAEADVYLALVRHGSLNGYQIAKLMNLSRSSVYAALNTLYRRNCVFLLPGASNAYRAEEPQTLMARLKEDYTRTADSLAEELRALSPNTPELRFFNVSGRDNVLDKARALVARAQQEVCINTSLDLAPLRDVLAQRAREGVRLIVVAAAQPALGIEALEFYPLSAQAAAEHERLMITVDDREVLIAGAHVGARLVAVFSENPVLVQIVAEHINHDVYLTKLQARLKAQVVSDDVRTWTLSERRFFDEIERLRQRSR